MTDDYEPIYLCHIKYTTKKYQLIESIMVITDKSALGRYGSGHVFRKTRRDYSKLEK